MKKRLLALLLCVSMIVSLVSPASVFAAEGDENLLSGEIEADVVESAPETESEPTYYEKIMAAETVEDMYAALTADEVAVAALTGDEIDAIFTRVDELDPEGDDADTDALVDLLISLPGFVSGAEAEGEEGAGYANNVYNVTQKKWYSTLSAATAAAADNNVIEVYNSFTETTSVKIQKNGLTIRAAAGYNPTIKWTKVDAVTVSGATPYHCVVIYTSVTTSTTFGGSTGTLTFDASLASDADNKGQRARVMVHCGKGTLYLKDGVVLTGGNTGGGTYESDKSDGRFPTGSGEIVGEIGFGSGLFMRFGTLYMSGGVIKDNYSLWGATAEDRETSHNYYGGGGGVYLYGTTDGTNKTTMIMTGGTITHNAAGSGGGGGILVGFNSTLNLSGGTISENVSRFASGGGIGVRTQSKVTISGGLIKDNEVEGHGGGLFARGDSAPLKITGGTFEGNVAGGYGGGILFWTVGDDVTKNTIEISGSTKIIGNKATDGGGISIGREVLKNVPIGKNTKLVISGSPEIRDNEAIEFGGGIHMQTDNHGDALYTVEISGGEFTSNEAVSGGAIYVPNGVLTITGGEFSENTASKNGAGIFVGGGTVTSSIATFEGNEAAENGGGLYVNNGSVVINSGSFKNNTAANGGGAYVNGGGIAMYGGTIEANTVPGNGGGLYVTGGNFTMISGALTNNKATGSTSYGGGAYVEDGDVYIGVENCSYTDVTGNHSDTANHTDKKHPIINSNTAQDSGGGLAVVGNGSITMYCGKIADNNAPNRGRGLNVYMEKGTFAYKNGMLGGNLNEPELVIVGGKLDVGTPYIDLVYFHCNDSQDVNNHTGTLATMTAAATEGRIIHLPDGEKYWKAATGYRFFGWTFYGPNNDNAKTNVRTKNDYKEMGEPIVVKDDDTLNYDGIKDGKIQMYALWAPDQSIITYEGCVIDGEFQAVAWTNGNNPDTYDFYVESRIVTLQPASKDGYTFKGWYIYQNLNQNANWGYEPAYVDGAYDFSAMTYLPAEDDGTYDLEMGTTLFGDITLIADFETAYGDLTISKTGVEAVDHDGNTAAAEEKQNSIFTVTGTSDAGDPVNMTVTIVGNASVVIRDLPVGTYTVTENTKWSWRYEPAAASQEAQVTIKDDATAAFTNVRKSNSKWLSGDNWIQNLLSMNTPTSGN